MLLGLNDTILADKALFTIAPISREIQEFCRIQYSFQGFYPIQLSENPVTRELWQVTVSPYKGEWHQFGQCQSNSRQIIRLEHSRILFAQAVILH